MAVNGGGAWLPTYGTPIAGGGVQSSTSPTGRYWNPNGAAVGDQSKLMALPIFHQPTVQHPAFQGGPVQQPGQPPISSLPMYQPAGGGPAFHSQHVDMYGQPAFQGGPVPAAPPMPQVNQLGLPAQAPGLGAQQPGFLGLPQQAGQMQGPGFGQGFGHWLGLLQSGQLGQLPPGLAQKPMFQPNQQTGMVNQGTNLVGGM